MPHFVATELLTAGIDIRTVANRLGHARVRDAAAVLDVSFQRVAQLAGIGTKQTTAAKRTPVKAVGKQHSSRKTVIETGKAKATATSR